MPAGLREIALGEFERSPNPFQSTDLSPSFQLAEDKASQPKSQPPELTENWQERENAEQQDVDTDIRLNELMEDIKRYIRSIDIGGL